MKKPLLLIVCILLLRTVNCVYGQQSTYSRVIWDSLQIGVRGFSIVPSFDNGFIIAGASETGLVLKIDSAGNVLWNKVLDINYSGVFNSIAATNDSCFVLAGSTYMGAATNALCVKINAAGDTLWTRTFAISGYELNPLSIQQTNDSGYIIAGDADSNGPPYTHILVMKLDAGGNLQWNTILTGGNQLNYAYAVKQTADSGYILTGYISSAPLYNDYCCVIKLSSSGAVVWSNKYTNNSGNDYVGYDIEIENDGYLCYLFSDGSATLMKTDFAGNVTWTKNYDSFGGFGFQNAAFKLHKTFTGNHVFVTAGTLIETDSVGNVIWQDLLYIYPIDVLEAKDTGLLVMGNGPLMLVESVIPMSPQIGLIKTDSLGNTPNCISQIGSSVEADTSVSSGVVFTSLSGVALIANNPQVGFVILVSDSGCVQAEGGVIEAKKDIEINVYPNPSNGAFTIDLSNVPSEKMYCQLIDYTGKIVWQKETTGVKMFSFSESNLPSGIYLFLAGGEKGAASQRVVIAH